MHTTQRNLIVALSVCAAVSAPNIASAVAISGQGTWETTLLGRDLNGNLSTIEAYYDTVLDITWLADANYAQTSGFDADGRMSWSVAGNWATSHTYGGYDTWRLPTLGPVNGPTFNTTLSYDGSTDRSYNLSAFGSAYAGSTASEMAHMYYVTLGNTGAFTTTGVGTGCVGSGPDNCLTNSGTFSNLKADFASYWTGYPYVNPGYAWYFSFTNGIQSGGATSSGVGYAWLVSSGDLGVAIPASTVPLPAAAWLFGSGLLGLIATTWRKNDSLIGI